MDVFRAIVKKGEMSERALELTEFLIGYNPAHYYIWYIINFNCFLAFHFFINNIILIKTIKTNNF